MPSDDLTSSISNWLKTRRAQFASHALQHGLPLTVTIPVPVAHLTENGMQGMSELQPHSPFAAAGPYHPMLFLAVSKPLIDDAGEQLAGALVEHVGDRVNYFFGFEPAILQQDLEHPDLIPKLKVPEAYPGDIAAQMPRWQPILYALVILRQCLLEYLASLSTLAKDNELVASQLARQMIRFVESDDVTYLGRIPLAALQIAGDRLAIADCSLCRLSPEELGYLLSRRQNVMYQPSRVASGLPRMMSPEILLQERIILEVRACHPKTSPFFPVAPRCQKLLLAFHLLGLEFAGAGFGAMLREPRWLWPTGQSSYPLLMPRRHPQSVTVVDENDLQSAISVADLIPDGAVNGPTSPMELSIRRVALAMARDEATESLVDYTVALEALFLGGTDVGEARRRFTLNGAVYVGTSSVERKRLYKELSDIYTARSVLVHGVSPTEPRAKKVLRNAPTIRDQACEIARSAIRKTLTTGWPKETDFVDALLDDPPQESSDQRRVKSKSPSGA
jgi:hypothetical protein